jgi:hypothetical protein
MKKMFSFFFSHIQRLGVIKDWKGLNASCVEMMKMVDSPDCETVEVATEFLARAHEIIDKAERNLLEAYKTEKI